MQAQTHTPFATRLGEAHGNPSTMQSPHSSHDDTRLGQDDGSSSAILQAAEQQLAEAQATEAQEEAERSADLAAERNQSESVAELKALWSNASQRLAETQQRLSEKKRHQDEQAEERGRKKTQLLGVIDRHKGTKPA